jgi:hypothetical protein
LDPFFVVHHEVGAGDHDAERWTEKRNEKRNAADARPFERNPILPKEAMQKLSSAAGQKI